jgi:hypothetical protein
MVLEITALDNRGRREGRELAAPMARVQQKSTRQNHRLGRDIPAFPARWLGGLYVISPGTGSFAPVARNARREHRDLDLSTGGQDHTISPAHQIVRPRKQAHVATRHAHRIPHPTSVTTAKRPLLRGGMEGSYIISEKKK